METINSNNLISELSYISPVWKRILAGIIDLICIAIIMAILLVTGALIVRLTDIPLFEVTYLNLLDKLADPNNTQLFDYGWILASLLYPTFSYLFFNNTLGKYILKLKVVHISGQGVSKWLFPFRLLIPFILFSNFLLIFIDVIILFFNKNHRAVHDYLFNTIVVNKNSNYQEVLGKVNQ